MNKYQHASLYYLLFAILNILTAMLVHQTNREVNQSFVDNAGKYSEYAKQNFKMS